MHNKTIVLSLLYYHSNSVFAFVVAGVVNICVHIQHLNQEEDYLQSALTLLHLFMRYV